MHIEIHYDGKDEESAAQTTMESMDSDACWWAYNDEGFDPPDVFCVDDTKPDTPEAPCDHINHTAIGYVEAGDPKTGPHASTHTCADCIPKSEGWAQLITGMAPHFHPFPKK